MAVRIENFLDNNECSDSSDNPTPAKSLVNNASLYSENSSANDIMYAFDEYIFNLKKDKSRDLLNLINGLSKKYNFQSLTKIVNVNMYDLIPISSYPKSTNSIDSTTNNYFKKGAKKLLGKIKVNKKNKYYTILEKDTLDYDNVVSVLTFMAEKLDYSLLTYKAHKKLCITIKSYKVKKKTNPVD